jgi:hypothetical protein
VRNKYDVLRTLGKGPYDEGRRDHTRHPESLGNQVTPKVPLRRVVIPHHNHSTGEEGAQRRQQCECVQFSCPSHDPRKCKCMRRRIENKL